MIGQKLSPILEEIESVLIEFTAQEIGPPKFTEDGFRGAAYIFFTVLMDKMWLLQEKEDITKEQRIAMVQEAGEKLKHFIKVYTDIDTHTLY